MEIWQDPVVYAVPVFLLTFLAEYFVGYRNMKDKYDVKEARASVLMGVGVVIIGVAWKALMFWVFTLIYVYSPAEWREWLSLDNPWAWVLCLFADDFSFYWHHRLSHSVRILWAAHENHHSARTLNLAVALRQSWGEIFYKFAFWAWMPLVGFHPLMIFMMMSISLIYQYFQHSDLVGKLGPLEWIFNTPSHHRVHHATNIRYLDRNHAGIFIIWDRLFGTFTEERDNEKPEYGVRKDFHSYNPFVIATHEYIDVWKDVRRARSISEALGYLFGPPGWLPKDRTQTTAYLQRQLRDEERKAQKTTVS